MTDVGMLHALQLFARSVRHQDPGGLLETWPATKKAGTLKELCRSSMRARSEHGRHTQWLRPQSRECRVDFVCAALTILRTFYSPNRSLPLSKEGIPDALAGLKNMRTWKMKARGQRFIHKQLVAHDEHLLHEITGWTARQGLLVRKKT